MERAISFMNEKGSIGHNTRSFIADNVDASRTKNNITLIHEDIKLVYHKLFDKALDEYNTKQKRKDRQIKCYYEKISRSKQEKLFYEVIVHIGNKNDTVVGSSAAEVATWVLKDYVKMFQLRNPQLYVIGAYIHLDEETPHLHPNFVPWVSGCKRGLETKTNLKAALATRGFASEGKGNTEWKQWAEAEKDDIVLIMRRYGIDWKKKNAHNQNLSVLDYKKQERAKEVVALEEELEGAQVVLELKEERIESLDKEIESKRDGFRKEQSEAQKRLDDTKAETQKLQTEDERNERLRKLKRRRASLNAGGDDGQGRTTSKSELRSTEDDIESFIRSLDAKERTSEEKRDDSISKRENREIPRERSRIEEERRIKERERELEAEREKNKRKSRSRGQTR